MSLMSDHKSGTARAVLDLWCCSFGKKRDPGDEVASNAVFQKMNKHMSNYGCPSLPNMTVLYLS